MPCRVWRGLPESVGDEADPGFGDAFESEEGLHWEAREDLQQDVVGEAGRRATLVAVAAYDHAAGRKGGRCGNRRRLPDGPLAPPLAEPSSIRAVRRRV